MTDIEIFRMKLGDYLKPQIDKEIGDGLASIYRLTHRHIQDYVVTIDGAEMTEETDYIMDASNGILETTTPPSDGDIVKVQYKYEGFTDADITALITQYSNVDNAIIEGIKALMADAARRFDYSEAQTDMKPSQIFDHLKQLLETHRQGATSLIVERIHPAYESETNPDDNDLSRSDLGMID